MCGYVYTHTYTHMYLCINTPTGGLCVAIRDSHAMQLRAWQSCQEGNWCHWAPGPLNPSLTTTKPPLATRMGGWALRLWAWSPRLWDGHSDGPPTRLRQRWRWGNECGEPSSTAMITRDACHSQHLHSPPASLHPIRRRAFDPSYEGLNQR